jgi:ribonuclease Z
MIFLQTILALTSAVLLAACTSGMQDAVVKGVIEQRFENVADPTAGDGLKVLVCGSSSPLPAKEAAGPCVAVAAGGRVWIVDAGDGSAENLALWGVPGGNLAGILLTHFHSDHIAEIPDISLAAWVAGRDEPFPVYGPAGVEDVVEGFSIAYRQSRKYRVAHHGADFLAPAGGRFVAHPIGIGPDDAEGRTVTVLEEGGLKITATRVSHAPVNPAVAYRFDFAGRSVVVSGDTTKSKAVDKLAHGVDVLLHEALAAHMINLMSETAAEVGAERPAKILHDIPDYHTTPVQAAELANSAEVRLLVYYHLVPYPENILIERVFLRGVSDVRDEGVMLGFDGLLIDLPPNSKEIEIDEIG